MPAIVRAVLRTVLAGALALAANARAEFHLFVVDQVYSNADRTIQFIVLRQEPPANDEHLWVGHGMTSTHGGANYRYQFPHDLPSRQTMNRRVLLATQGFADLGIVTPDYIVPNAFLGTGQGRITCCEQGYYFEYTALPVDGVMALDQLRRPVPNVATNFAGASGSVTAEQAGGPPGSPAFDLNRHGLTGSWFQPATSGQGIEIEVYPNLAAAGTGFLQGSWFTFDHVAAGGAARQRWYTFSGNVKAGQPSATLTLYRNAGGNFNALPVTSATIVGTVELAFTDCTSGTMTYAFTDGSARSGTISLVRLMPNVTCSTSDASATDADFAYSGNWFDPATAGQGIVLEVNPTAATAFFAWYTYAPNGQAQAEAGQRWYTGQGSYTAGARTLPLTLYETTGGLFDSATPASRTVSVGTATATFTSCAAGRLTFTFTGGSSAGASGTIDLSRVGPTPAGCSP